MRPLLWLAVCAGSLSSLVILSITNPVSPLQPMTDWIVAEVRAAAVFFVPSITVGELNDTYRSAAPSPLVAAEKVRVLIVPGHQPQKGGTEFNGIYERDIVVDIADALAALLLQNPHYEVTVARSKSAWNPVLQTYFDTHVLEIDTFRQSQAAQMADRIADGSILPQADQIYHTTTSSEAALQLYGINKWASDNQYDIALHLHLNDYAGRRRVTEDSYTGFAIYVPNRQYSNAEASHAIGEAIAVRLNAYHATSTLPREDVGVVEDMELIAIGSNNSVDAAAMLIEYGYIYEPQFHDASVRMLAVQEYAFETYLGLQDFFKDPTPSMYGSSAFPYDWSGVEAKKGERGPGVYALQSALRSLGHYPPKGRTFSDCPISGKVGPCTTASIREYQTAKGISATGIIGPRTREALEQDTRTANPSTLTLR